MNHNHHLDCPLCILEANQTYSIEEIFAVGYVSGAFELKQKTSLPWCSGHLLFLQQSVNKVTQASLQEVKPVNLSADITIN